MQHGLCVSISHQYPHTNSKLMLPWSYC